MHISYVFSYNTNIEYLLKYSIIVKDIALFTPHYPSRQQL